MKENNPYTKVYLVRHGITDWLEEGYLQGISDRPLSRTGLEQAELTGEAMRGVQASHLFASPLLRTIQTAQPIARNIGLPIEPVEGFKEMSYGWLEGKRNLWPKLKRYKTLGNIYVVSLRIAGCIGGETLNGFRKHVMRAWKGIRSQTYDKPIIIVAHFNVLRTILMSEFGFTKANAKKFLLGTCSISEIEISANAPSRIIRINDVRHLNGKTQI